MFILCRWQFTGLSREKAEELLQLPYNQAGSFLIRESQSEPGEFTHTHTGTQTHILLEHMHTYFNKFYGTYSHTHTCMHALLTHEQMHAHSNKLTECFAGKCNSVLLTWNTIVSTWQQHILSRLPSLSLSCHVLSHAGAHALSVRRSSSSSSSGYRPVKHYRIHCLENGWHYISPRLTFPSLSALVEHYSGGLKLTVLVLSVASQWEAMVRCAR